MHHMDDPLYDNIAAFTAGLVANGVTEVVISPGSRSTPLSITLHAHPDLRTWVHLDERSAGFFALGMARVTGRPAVLVCTSGTAAANYLPAVVEAHHGGVPMIVCTADRPPELQGWGAGQTIDQTGIYGSATRWAAQLPVSSEWSAPQAERTAMRAVAAATRSRPGPVHLNWPFRLPLEPMAVPPVRDPEFRPSPATSRAESSDGSRWSTVIDDISTMERGVIVVGPSDGVGLAVEHETARIIREFAEAMQWPVLAEPLAQMRRIDDTAGSTVIATADHLLRSERFADLMVPEVVVRIGRAPTTKSVRLWIERHRPDRVVLIDPSGHWQEPSFTLTDHIDAQPASLLAGRSRPDDDRGEWLTAWRHADHNARTVIDTTILDGPLLAPLAARTVVDSLPDEAVLITSNSMPVRDLDSFVPTGTPSISVVGNRGASGIDGVTSTALGVSAATEQPVVLLIGDLALLHDVGALLAAKRLGLHLTVVCVDNDGGEIFSMLPIAEHGSDVDFDTLFRTSHGIQLAGLDGLGGVRVHQPDDDTSLSRLIKESLAGARPGVDLIVVAIDHDTDVAQHRDIATAVNSVIDP